MNKITITRFSTARSNRPSEETVSIDQFAQQLRKPTQMNLAAGEFFGWAKEQQREWKAPNLAAFSPAKFRAGSERKNDNVESVACLVLDLDKGSETVAHIAARLGACRWPGVVYTTISDREDSTRRSRVVIFTDRAMSPEECKLAREECATQLNVASDPATGAASNLFYLPAQLQGGTFSAKVIEGDPVRVEEILARASVRPTREKAARRTPDTIAAGAAAPAPDSGGETAADGASVKDSGEDEHSDEEILKLLRKRNKRGKITRLWDGKLEDYAGDASSADMALASEIAFYTQDTAQAERLFGLSKLAERAKWKERADYRAKTISKAVGDATGYYWDGDASAPGLPSAKLRESAEKLTGGLEGLTLGGKGKLAANISNAIQLLLRDHRTQGLMGFNLFSGEPEVLRPLRDVFGASAVSVSGAFIEADITPIRAWLIREWGVDLRKNDALDAVIDWARHCAFNPVTDALARCADRWDKVARLDTWLTEYVGVGESQSAEYTREVGRRWMISAVARAFAPGCKVDHVLVLEGAQGAGKSLTARTLAEAVYPAGFVDAIPVLSDKHEAARSLRGTWLAELAELTSFRRAEAEHIKAFLTTQADRIRDPYERRYANWPRTCVFLGTTNLSEYNPDDSGGRRLWSVVVGKIDIDSLRRDAAQLWGEAVHAYRAGESWHLTTEGAVREAAQEQRSRQVSDVWDEALAELVTRLAAAEGYPLWAIGELFALAFKGENLDARPQGDQKRFAGALRRAGFESKKTGGRMRWRLTQEARKGARAAGP